MTYVPGDYFVICDLCGFQRRRSETRKNYKKQIVCADTCFEHRHPQEYVKARSDKIRVKDARPPGADRYLLSYSTTYLASAVTMGGSVITVDDASGISDGYHIAVVLDEGGYCWTTVNGSPDGNDVTLTNAVSNKASVDNEVYYTSTLNRITASDL